MRNLPRVRRAVEVIDVEEKRVTIRVRLPVYLIEALAKDGLSLQEWYDKFGEKLLEEELARASGTKRKR